MKQPELPITRPSKLASNSRASYHRAVWWRTCHCRVTSFGLFGLLAAFYSFFTVTTTVVVALTRKEFQATMTIEGYYH